MAVEFGVLIPTREAVMSGHPETAPLLAMAERAEAAGFDSVWIGDSLIARPRHEPLTLMAAIAGRTRRVRLGTGVLLPALRNPVVLAHIVGTLDRAAEGRVILGVGFAADNPSIRKEFAAAGVPFERRIGRFLETIEICQALWRRDHVSFSGKHFALDDVAMGEASLRPGGPPVWIGGSSPAALPGRAFRRVVSYRAQRGNSSPSTFRACRRRRAPQDARPMRSPARRTSRWRARRESRRRRAAAVHALRDVLCGTGADDPGPPGRVREGRSRAARSGSSAGSTPARALHVALAGGDQLAQVDEAAGSAGLKRG
jgi:alkanesulfonate monooxygenase SsuD/methylene tetrahydromethanopterin reductase-like flavin-dependent oxidoreductase (luciferase family)